MQSERLLGHSDPNFILGYEKQCKHQQHHERLQKKKTNINNMMKDYKQ